MMIHRLTAIIFAFTFTAFVSAAAAQEQSAPPPPDAAIAPAEEPAPQPAPPPPGPVISPDLKEITWIGFKQMADRSRVFVRTNEAASYRITMSPDNKMILTIFNAAIVSPIWNRPLNTEYFAGPVVEIRPETLGDITPSVQVIISLRGELPPYEVRQEDALIYIDFSH